MAYASSQIFTSDAPVELIQWTASGKVQVRRTRVVGGAQLSAVFGIYEAVPVMALSHADGRHALVAALRKLPVERSL